MKINLIDKLKALFFDVNQIKLQSEDVHLLLGTILSQDVDRWKSINEAEFKVFSQFGDDGILQYLIKKLPVSNESFIEFGVETYQESNTRFLLMHNNWRGLVIDGSKVNINYIKKDPIYWKHNFTAISSFITAENINELFSKNGFEGPIGLLSIDIDGNDYWVWQAINAVTPEIVVVEYNSIFGNERSITVPYKPDFVRTSMHYSNLYFGASLPALHDLGLEKGYMFLGCNKAGNNAYFVKKEFKEFIDSKTLEEGFVQAKFRESRSTNGKLSFLPLTECRNLLTGLPVFNTRTQQIEVF